MEGAEKDGKPVGNAVEDADTEKKKISKLGGKEGESLECFLALAPKGKEIRFQRVLPYSGGVFVFVGCIVFWETR